MQFLASTWVLYGVAAEGDRQPDRWDPADAIYSAANYLRASGAPFDYSKAIYAYNHAWWYVKEVQAWAARYEGGQGPEGPVGGDVAGPPGADASAGPNRAISQQASSTPVLYVPGSQAKLLRGDAHLALIPEEAPPAVQAMIVAGNELQGLPYGPTGHPDPLGADSEDCSSTVNYVLFRSGVRSLAEIVRENPLAQDYVHWGERGPGRWVTIYATDLPQPHVFVTIAGLRLDTVGGGTDEGPNSAQEGPRWRLLPYIPTWAHWSVRHPRGL
jgi:Transglycosylase SLT domain